MQVGGFCAFVCVGGRVDGLSVYGCMVICLCVCLWLMVCVSLYVIGRLCVCGSAVKGLRL